MLVTAEPPAASDTRDMVLGSASQPTRPSSLPHASGEPDPVNSPRNDSSSHATSSAHENPAPFLSQPARPSSLEHRALSTDRQEEADKAAARRARRQKRIEENAYKVNGWEDLYRGNGFKPVYSRQGHPPTQQRQLRESSVDEASHAFDSASMNTCTYSQTQNAPAIGRSSTEPHSESRSEQRSDGSSDGSQLPPSTAPVTSLHSTAASSTVRLGKRKVPSTHPQSNARSSGAPVRDRTDSIPEGQDSDDDFEIVGVSGPAAKRSRVNDLATTASIKASPSPDEALRSPQLAALPRRSLSQAPTHTPRISPAASAPPFENMSALPASTSTARERSQSRQPSESSASETTDSNDLTFQHAEALTESTHKALTQGVSLVDHLRNVVQVYGDTLSDTHRHRTIVDQLQRKLADFGPRATVKDIQSAVQTAPKRLARRFIIVFHAYELFRARGGRAQRSNTDATSAPTIGANAIDVTEGEVHIGESSVPPPVVTSAPDSAALATVTLEPAEPPINSGQASGASPVSSTGSPRAFATPPQHLEAPHGHQQAERIDEVVDEMTNVPVQDGCKTAPQLFQASRGSHAYGDGAAAAVGADTIIRQPPNDVEPASDVGAIADVTTAGSDLVTGDGTSPADDQGTGRQQPNDNDPTPFSKPAATNDQPVDDDQAAVGGAKEAGGGTRQHRQLTEPETGEVAVLNSSPSPSTVAAPPISEASANAAVDTRPGHVTAAEAALSAITEANPTLSETLIDVDEPTAAVSVQPEQRPAREAGTGCDSTAMPTTVTEGNTDPLRDARTFQSARARSLSITHMNGRPKMTISDRMKSMLKDLSTVTKRASSFSTIQKLKPRRAGLSTERTVRDLAEKWQDPARMIPWTCLQDLGPNIFHKNAHWHLHRSLHELMDRVSNTRSVKHLLAKVPERVMTRALMEFPRIPHMLHCWNEEKRKYFASRGLPEPTLTQPEFRFADGGGVESSSSFAMAFPAHSESVSRGFAPLPTSKVLANDSTHGGGGEHKKPTPGFASTQLHSSELSSATSSTHPQQLVSSVLPQVPHVPMQSSVSSPASVAFAAGEAVQHIRPLSAGVPTALARQQQMHAQPAEPLVRPPDQRNAVQTPSKSQLQLRAQPPQHQTHLQITPHRPSLEIIQLRRQEQQRQQQQQTSQSNTALFAATVRQASEQMFSGLVADCLSFAEHVIGTNAAAEMVRNHHFAESDVLHVVDYVVKVYQKEVASERTSGGQNRRAEERYAKVLKVENAAIRVLALTKMLTGVRMCIIETASDSLRSTGVASTQDWQERLWTSSKWHSIVEYLVREETGWKLLSHTERHMLLHSKVVRMNKELETTLEKMMDIDDLVGAGDHADEESEEQIRKECQQIGAICCKHVVDILGDSDQSSHSR